MNIIRNLSPITAALCLAVCAALAHGERIESRQLGIGLDVPAGWVVQDNGSALLLAEPGMAGLYVITTHDHASADALMADPASTRVEDGSTVLERRGAFERMASGSIAARYAGTLEGVAVIAYAVTQLRSSGGGANVLAVAPVPDWRQTHEERARDLLRAVEIPAGETAPANPIDAGSTRTPFTGRRLVSVETSDTAYDGSGTRNRETADFCADGRFFLYEESSLSANVAGGSAAQRQASTLAAQWTAVRRGDRHHVTLTNADGSAVLVVTPIVDRFGDRGFQIGDRTYYVSGQPDCRG